MRSDSIQKMLACCLALALLVGFAPPLAPSMEAAQAPPGAWHFQSTGEQVHGTAESAAPLHDAYSKLPLYFIANEGQVDESVGYYVQGGGHSIYFTAEEVVMALDETVLRMRFVGAKATLPLGAEKRAAKINYLIGNDPAQWQTNVPTYGQVVYQDLYPGIDLRYAGQTGALKYTFVVQPGADVSHIRLACGGAAGLRLDEAGNLLILAGGSELKDTKPHAYQEIGGRRVAVETEFVLHGVRTYGLAVRGDYDPRYPLVIDPTLLYSTYLGGGASLGMAVGNDRGEDIALDGAGNAYVTGYVETTDFPTRNPYQGTYGGNYGDAFIAKIDPSQSGAASLVYATYLGGESGDVSRDIAVDGAGNAYVSGTTLSPNFPVQNAYRDQCNQCDREGGIGDVFVAKLNADGNGLLYSTYLGGTENDITYGGIAVAGAGSVYVAGYTMSPDFPTTAGAFDTTCGTDGNCNYNAGDSIPYFSDVFVTRFDTTKSGNASLVYSTYLGGSDRDFGLGLALDGADNIYVTGYTDSANFPTQNACQETNPYPGVADVFVTKFNATGTNLLYSTYLGGTGGDRAWDIAVDGAGSAYVTGDTNSNDFPTRNAYQGTIHSFVDAFVARIDTTQSGAASLVYSTYLGGSHFEESRGIALDGAGNAYVAGSTTSPDFPTTAGAFDTTCGTDGNCNADPLYSSDAFVTQFNATGDDLFSSTYLGGSNREFCYDIALDGAGNLYVTGETESTDFPTQNAFQETHAGGDRDAFVAALSVDRPDLSTSSKQVSPATIVPTGTVTHTLLYTITLANTGNLTATTAYLTDTLPSDLSLSVNPACPGGGTCGYNAPSHTVTWTGILSPSAAVVITYAGLVSVPIGTTDTYYFVNTAQVDDRINAPFILSARSAVNPQDSYLPLIRR